ncbi:MAG: hypothetical protein LBR83_05895, partial [Clostridiales bacterium]|jgi:hypothetical protein|nr:hypothetical protein [Clostridiales bacterium]
MDIAPGMADGARVNQGDPVMRTARMDTRFMIKAALNRSQDFISVGQSASVAVEDKKISGVVDRIFSESGETIAVIAFSSDSSLYGKWAEITVSGPVASSNQVIPVSALREDNTGYYLLYIEAEERFLGYDYFARIRRVENVAARDAHYAAIESNGLKEDTAIVINSDRPVYEGDRVRLTGGDDSFGAR